MGTIIIVDDEKSSREGIKLILERSGLSMDIFEFTNGLDALAWLGKNKADIALVDMKMPFMSGVEFIKEVRSLEVPGAIKCIVLSGYSEFAYAADSMKYGALQYLLKPVHRGELIETIKKTEQLIAKEREITERLNKADLIRNSRYDAIVDQLDNLLSNRSDIDKALAYIEENYQKDINMATVANTLSLEYSYFSRMFKNVMNINFIDYLRKVRIEKAMGLLISTNLKITKIAQKVGYTNSKNFTSSFKQFSGVTPSEYRQNYITKNNIMRGDKK